MIGLDTNVLVRYLVRDDPGQSLKATEFITASLNSENPGFISIVAIVELVWVLTQTYRLEPGEVVRALKGLLAADHFVIEHEAEVATAMTAVREGIGSFADALIATLGQRAGCAYTLTFDRKASRLPGFRLA
jgi:predicted nucleic-acid-binding protein